jgi:hypothetical protein
MFMLVLDITAVQTLAEQATWAPETWFASNRAGMAEGAQLRPPLLVQKITSPDDQAAPMTCIPSEGGPSTTQRLGTVHAT